MSDFATSVAVVTNKIEALKALTAKMERQLAVQLERVASTIDAEVAAIFGKPEANGSEETPRTKRGRKAAPEVTAAPTPVAPRPTPTTASSGGMPSLTSRPPSMQTGNGAPPDN